MHELKDLLATFLTVLKIEKYSGRHEKSPNIKSPKLKTGPDSPLQAFGLLQAYLGIEPIAPDRVVRLG